jgi:hypothetical protein
MDCSTSLTEKASLPQVNPLVADYGSGVQYYANGWTTVFDYVDNVNCAVTGCVLMNSDCTSNLAVDTTTFYIDTSSPWRLRYNTNIVAGWSAITFCYKCSGSGFSK